jgi:hypothetical protein
MTRPEHLEHFEGLRRIEGFPTNEDFAVRVVVRFYADRSLVCTGDEARRILRELRS